MIVLPNPSRGAHGSCGPIRPADVAGGVPKNDARGDWGRARRSANVPAMLGGARERSVDLLRGFAGESKAAGKVLWAGASSTTKQKYYAAS